ILGEEDMGGDQVLGTRFREHAYYHHAHNPAGRRAQDGLSRQKEKIAWATTPKTRLAVAISRQGFDDELDQDRSCRGSPGVPRNRVCKRSGQLRWRRHAGWGAVELQPRQTRRTAAILHV